MKKILSIVTVGIIILVIFFWAFVHPALTLKRLVVAATNGHAIYLEKHIDFDKVKVNIKNKLRAEMMKDMAKNIADNPFAGLGLMLGDKLIDSIIDPVLTPQGLISLVGGKKANPVGIKYHVSYTSLTTRIITIDKDGDADKISITMQTKNIINWVVVNVDFDINKLKDIR